MNSKDRIKELEAEVEMLRSEAGYHVSLYLNAKDAMKALSAQNKALQSELEKWKEKYPCCEGSIRCCNNRLVKFVEEILGKGEWTKKKDYLYSVIETLESDKEWAKFKRKELHDKLQYTLRALDFHVSMVRFLHLHHTGERDEVGNWIKAPLFRHSEPCGTCDSLINAEKLLEEHSIWIYTRGNK